MLGEIMTGDLRAQALHDKATRGEALSAEEQAQVDEWYARLDQEEGAALTKTLPPQRLATLHAQIDVALAHLLIVTERVQKQLAENEQVRQEIVVLQRQLAQSSTAQPA